MSKNFVTIIALCYNHSEFVIEALDSISNQSGTEYEIIITDDGSSDDSVGKIKSWKNSHKSQKDIKLILNEINLGLCRTLNNAIEKAQGEWIKPISCDDILEDDYLKTILPLLNKGDKELYCSDMSNISYDGQLIRKSNWEYNGIDVSDENINSIKLLLEGTMHNTPTLIFKKSLWEKVGKYDEELSFEDWDFLLRALRHTRFGFINKVLVRYRLHKNNMHKQIGKDIKYSLDIIRLLAKNYYLFPDIVLEKIGMQINELLKFNTEAGLKYWAQYRYIFETYDKFTDDYLVVILHNDSRNIFSTLETCFLSGCKKIVVITDNIKKTGFQIESFAKLLSVKILGNLDELRNNPLVMKKLLVVTSGDLLTPETFKKMCEIKCNDKEVFIMKTSFISDDKSTFLDNMEYNFRIISAFNLLVTNQPILLNNTDSTLNKVKDKYDLHSFCLEQTFQSNVRLSSFYAVIRHDFYCCSDEKTIDIHANWMIDKLGFKNKEDILYILKALCGKGQSLKSKKDFLAINKIIKVIIAQNSDRKYFDSKALQSYFYKNVWYKGYIEFKDEFTIREYLSFVFAKVNLTPMKHRIKVFVKVVLN